MELGRLLQKEREKVLSLEQKGRADEAASQKPSETPEEYGLRRSKTISSRKAQPDTNNASPSSGSDALRIRAQLLEIRKIQQQQKTLDSRLQGLFAFFLLSLSLRHSAQDFSHNNLNQITIINTIEEMSSRKQAEKELADLKVKYESAIIELEETKKKIAELRANYEVNLCLFHTLNFPIANIITLEPKQGGKQVEDRRCPIDHTLPINCGARFHDQNHFRNGSGGL